MRLGAGDRCRGFGVATGRQRSSQLLEAGVGPRGALVQDAAQVVSRARVQGTPGDRSVELRHGGIILGHPTNTVLDATLGEEPLRLSQTSVGELQLKARSRGRVKGR